MKKIKFLIIIAIVAIIGFSMTSCDLGEILKFGGTLTIKNTTGGLISAGILNVEYVGKDDEANVTIQNNGSHTWTFNLDGEVTYSWAGIGGNGISGELLKKINISGGKKEVITAK